MNSVFNFQGGHFYRHDLQPLLLHPSSAFVSPTIGASITSQPFTPSLSWIPIQFSFNPPSNVLVPIIRVASKYSCTLPYLESLPLHNPILFQTQMPPKNISQCMASGTEMRHTNYRFTSSYDEDEHSTVLNHVMKDKPPVDPGREVKD
jgi:hypothetical protein